MVTGIKGKVFIGLMLLCTTVWGQKKRSFPLTIHFQNQVGSRLLQLDSTYSNPYDEAFTVRNFRYYISHLVVTGANGKTYNLPETSFLIDERKPESKTITANIPFPAIRAIYFQIGVDSAKNVSGVQTGALDPANGMFWTWNSGYIMAKLEGTSPQAKAPQSNFTYHIGGFRTGENAVRKVSLPLPKPAVFSQQPITILADINTWFSGVYPFKIADQASIMTPGPQAMQIADNYSHMFSIAVPD